MEWIIPSNDKIYNIEKAFSENGFIFWTQNYYFQPGDIVYIYSSKPYSRIRFMARVEEIDLHFNNIKDDKIYWKDLEKYELSKRNKFMKLKLIKRINNDLLNYNNLKNNGLLSNLQSSIRVNNQLSTYIKEQIQIIFTEEIKSFGSYFEGSRYSTLIELSERNTIARKTCLDHYGFSCLICGFNFEEFYGKHGKEFIHVHHIKHLSDIKKEYKVDPIKDLIPVCPNCHAMLHKRKENEEYPTVDEIRKLLN